ncbi:glycoside hydrolase family 6 protein [Streptomyces sp. NPDC012616]|uniref:glycoside hydrolase family 6 protein n=1 Tax=Streptomyces sp. NPDC012616 TaxID=3364840 RepID=UPI0036F01469
MKAPRPPRRAVAVAVAAALTACAALTATQAQARPEPQPPSQSRAAPRQDAITAGTRFYADPHSKAAQQALVDLKHGDLANAANMARLASWPQAEWFTEGTPGEVRAKVRRLVHRAGAAHRTPVLVAYDVPGRDCSQYSSGGAASSAAYRQWIDAFAAGIGRGRALVVVEPDGMALLPKDCGPGTDPTGALTAARIADLGYAVRTLKALPRTAVYLDAGNVLWRVRPALPAPTSSSGPPAAAPTRNGSPSESDARPRTSTTTRASATAHRIRRSGPFGGEAGQPWRGRGAATTTLNQGVLSDRSGESSFCMFSR